MRNYCENESFTLGCSGRAAGEQCSPLTTCRDKTKGQTIGLPFRKVIANL